MTATKNYLQKVHKSEYLITYADDNAIGYFKKQGFYKSLRMVPDRWKQYIKHYTGGTLMECYLNPAVDFGTIRDEIKE